MADARVKAVDTGLSDIELTEKGSPEVENDGPFSQAVLSKRAESRRQNKFSRLPEKGQYIADPNYKPCCIGISGRDWAIVVTLIISLYIFISLFGWGLFRFVMATQGSWGLYVYFAVFLFALMLIGFAVFTGQEAIAEQKAKAAKEAAENV